MAFPVVLNYNVMSTSVISEQFKPKGLVDLHPYFKYKVQRIYAEITIILI